MLDVSVSLQCLRANGNQLLDTINNVRPHVDHLIDDASNVHVIEYVKGKMVEGVQLGITSKFSAPGKYRRNMKHLRKALSKIDAVEEEVKVILQDGVFLDRNEPPETDEENSPSMTSPLQQDNESDIISMVQQEPTEPNEPPETAEENSPMMSPHPQENESDIISMVQKEDVSTNDLIQKLDNTSVEDSLEMSGSFKVSGESGESKVKMFGFCSS